MAVHIALAAQLNHLVTDCPDIQFMAKEAIEKIMVVFEPRGEVFGCTPDSSY